MEDYTDCVVLIVDDAETNIDILVNTLEDDFDLRVAMDGETALKDVKEYPPDLILLDIMMPEIDGYEVCRRLKENNVTNNIPIIFLTAMTESKDEAKGLELGAIDYISKPFSPELVKARVYNHIKLKKANDEIRKLYEDLKASNQEIKKLQEEISVLKVNIDLEKKDASISQVVESEYFKELKEKVDSIKCIDKKNNI